MNLAPVILFVYNRPEHTKQTIYTLLANNLAEQTELHIYADGPKAGANETQLDKIQQVRRIIHDVKGFKKIYIKESSLNTGLANSIIGGVTEVVNTYGKVIVLEDDITTSQYFLQFMNDALQMYESEEKVFQIGACNVYDIKTKEHCFFLDTPDCLGWATWQDRWRHFERSPVTIMKELKKDKKAWSVFNAYDSFDYTEMLQKQIDAKVDSWAIRWQGVVALQKGIVLYPSPSLTQHRESEKESATHYAAAILPELLNQKADLRKIELQVTKSSVKKVKDYHKNLRNELKKFLYKENVLSYSVSFLRIKYGSLKIMFRKLIKQSAPSVLLKAFSQKDTESSLNTVNQWTGNFKDWDNAIQSTSGYDDINILEKCKNALLQVKNGEAVYERDSVLFDKIQYAWPLLACLENIALSNNQELNVIDFGGSLGSTYFQNRGFLKDVILKWVIVEQPEFVLCGKENFQNNILSFEYSLEEAMNKVKADCILLSGVLQYLPEPFNLIKKIVEYKIKNVIIDRTGFVSGGDDMLTVQNVPETIYKASYPCWFFNEKIFIEQLSNEMNLVADFRDAFTTSFTADNKQFYWKGFYFRRND